MNIFRENADKGTVVVLKDIGLPAVVDIQDLGQPWADDSLVTVEAAGWNRVVNMQSQPTIGTSLYFFALGFGVSAARLTGWIFLQPCGGQGARTVQQMEQAFINKSPIINDNPVRISVANNTISGFLKELKFETTIDKPNMLYWQLDMVVIPPSAIGGGRD